MKLLRSKVKDLEAALDSSNAALRGIVSYVDEVISILDESFQNARMSQALVRLKANDWSESLSPRAGVPNGGDEIAKPAK